MMILSVPGALITNPSPPVDWDTRGEPFSDEPCPWSVLPCGCHLRSGDLQAILCLQHLHELNTTAR